MIKRNSFFSLTFLLLFLLAPGYFFAQTFTGRVRTYDVQHYVLRSNFDREKKTYYGDATIRIKPLAGGFDSLVLDAAGLKFDSVTLDPDGSVLQYKQTEDKITVALGRTYAPEDVISVRFKYSAQPRKGIYFVDESREDGRLIRSSQIWTQGEPEEARHWFPSYDFPDDKATSEQFLTVEKNETAIANGELVETIDNPDGTKTFHYRMPVVHPTYLTSFVIGQYAKVEGNYKNIPLGYYVYPGLESIVPLAYGRTPDILRIFEELTGVAYPYNKYDQTMVANFSFGGMENITATTMADTEILFARTAYGRESVTDLVSHEIAHSWFGNLVTTKDWSNLWLNEGFATFMEAAFREKLNGRADYIRKIREDAARAIAEDSVNPNAHALLRLNPPLDDALFDTTTYQKGGAVVHTLRETVGDEVFWRAINAYLNRHKFDNAETDDLEKIFEDTSGKDLNWFFDQWVRKAGFPALTVRQAYIPSTKRLTLTVTQTQKTDAKTPAAFILPMDIEIQTASGAQTERINIDKRTQTFAFKVSGKPLKVVLDKDLKIPLKTVRMIGTAAPGR